MVTEGAFLYGAKALDGALRGEVALVGFELDADAVQVFEGVFEQQVLGFGVGGGALVLDGKPGAADFEAAVLGADFQVAGAADGEVGG